jgi:hypothetical protein
MNFKFLIKKQLFVLLLVFSILVLQFSLFLFPVYAASSPWSQTDWSGDGGQTSWSDATKFSSSSNLVFSTLGQLTISPTSGWCSNSYCNSSWKYREKITFNNTDASLGVTSENLVNFPVLVQLSSSNIDYTKTQDLGEDIRFVDTDGSDLAYEIEKWDETGTSLVWVKVPQIDINSNTDYIYIYYGNTSATDHQQVTSVWDSNYIVVYHLNDATTSTITNSTVTTAPCTKKAANEPIGATGQIGTGQDFDGTDDIINCTDVNTLDGLTNITTEAWVKWEGTANSTTSERTAVRKQGTNGSWALGVGWDTAAHNKARFYVGNGTTFYSSNDSTTNVATGGYFYIAGTYDANIVRIFVNGAQQNSNTIGAKTLSSTTSQVTIGAYGTTSERWNGVLDEVRVSNIARSAAWLAASYKSETNAFNTFIAEEERYVSSGTLTSSIFDTEQSSNWGTLTYNTDGVATTVVKARTSDSSLMAGATDFGSCNVIASGTDISGNNCVTDAHHYIQYQIALTSVSANTPVFQDVSIVFAASDATPPGISLTALSPDPNSDNTPSLTGTATDASGTVTNVQYQMDGTGGSWSSCVANDTSFNSASEAFTCTASALSDGSHTMYVRATDSNENTTSNGSASTDVFEIDATAPSVPGTPSTASAANNTKPVWTWTASTDGGSGLAATPYTLQWSEDSSFVSGVSSGTSATNSFTHSVALTDGTWYFRVKATDLLGNPSSYSSNGSFTLATSVPTGSVSINSGASYTNSLSVTLNISAADDGYDSADLDMKISKLSDLSDASYENYSTTKSWTLPSTDGTKTVYIKFKNPGGAESEIYSSSIVLDTTSPISLDLNSPGGSSYTSSERPTFKWRTASDAASGISTYSVEIDNGDSGDFSLDGIPNTRTTDYETNKYIAHYENFSDSDTTNDYISVYTKSSADWGSDNNDGKLKEGARRWTVKIKDGAGNETSSSRDLFVDRTGPSIESKQIDGSDVSDDLTTADQTPTISGKLVDSLAGDKVANKVASGPKEVEIKFEKKNSLGIYSLYALTTFSTSPDYWSDTGSEITNSSQNTYSKYSNFSYTPTDVLPLGVYRITLTGRDEAGNSSASSFNLTVTDYEEISQTPEIKEKVEELKEISKNKTKEIVKEHVFAVPETSAIFSTITGGAGKIAEIAVNGWWNMVEADKKAVNMVVGFASGVTNEEQRISRVVFTFVGTKINQSLVLRGQKIEEQYLTIARTYLDITQKAPGVLENGMLSLTQGANNINMKIGGIGNSLTSLAGSTASNLNTAWQTNKELIKPPAIPGAAAFVSRLNIATNTFISIVFNKEPTRIANVQVKEISSTEATITWETNDYATSKVNYGFSTSYGEEVFSNELVKEHKLVLKNLKPEELYYFEVMSHGKNYVYDAYRTFTTPK